MNSNRRFRGRYSLRRRAIALVVASLVAAPALIVQRAAEATYPGGNGKIAFSSDHVGFPSGDYEIYTINPDGTGLTALTANVGATDRQPAWSADGTQLVYTSTADGGDSDIWRMNADGSGQTQLTFNGVEEGSPDWSPDGTQIVFNSLADGDWEIYTMNAADGSGLSQITTNGIFDCCATYSPDGSTFAFQRGGYDIWSMNVDGTGATQLSFPPPSYSVGPTWAPDGSRILFARDFGYGSGWAEIFAMNPDGTALLNLTNTCCYWESDATYSPDGAQIAFISNKAEGHPYFDLYMMNADGSGYASLFAAAGQQSDVDWQPLVDTTPPEITITTPADGADYLLGSTVYADYGCEDPGSGVASCVGTVADGAAIDTSTVGAKNFTVDAEDNGGYQSSRTHTYNVVYDFAGFFSPVDNPPVQNSMKAGAAVPVSFSLGGNQGLDVFAAGYPKSQTITCGSTDPVDGVEQTVTAGSSVLSYDDSTARYTYVWKTSKTWAGSCRQLVLGFDDGTQQRANFLLK